MGEGIMQTIIGDYIGTRQRKARASTSSVTRAIPYLPEPQALDNPQNPCNPKTQTPQNPKPLEPLTPKP